MGMFDYIRCEVLLPDATVHGFTANTEFQTKDTPSQFLDKYLIKQDGTLWKSDYDIEDQSDPNATGISSLLGQLTKVNHRWVQLSDYRGAIEFYYYRDGVDVAYSAIFIDGKLIDLKLQE